MSKLMLILALIVACSGESAEDGPTECLTMEGGAYTMRLSCDNGVMDSVPFVADGPLLPEGSIDDECIPSDGYDSCAEFFDFETCTHYRSETGPGVFGYFELRPTSETTAVGVVEFNEVSCNMTLSKRNP